jgi:hypothetical protein
MTRPRLYLLAALALSASVAGCASACNPTPKPPPPGPVGGTGGVAPVPVGGAAGAGGQFVAECAAPADDCARAGCNLWRRQCRDDLGHPAWEGPKGEFYAEGCRWAEAHGEYWGQTCLATVTSCYPTVIAAARRAQKGSPCP